MTVNSSSNDNGRSLEYFITAELQKRTGCSLSQKAAQSQSRDASTVTQISPTLRASFVKAAKTSADWIVNEVGGTTGIAFEVDRANDGDVGVADLIVTSKKQRLLISVKHNHDALSHPRPYSLVEAVGFGGTAITFGETVPALGVDTGVTAKLGTGLDITEDEGGNTFTTLLVTAVFVETLSDTIELLTTIGEKV